MNNDFDFSKVGKRMPYTTPDDFFSRLESDIYKEVKASERHDRHRRRMRLRLITGAMAAAACLAGLFVMTLPHAQKHDGSMQSVEHAFDNLSGEDQAYMLEVYQEDIFLNE